MKKFLLLLTPLFLTACLQEPDSPKTVADKYWQLLQMGNTAEAEKLVSTTTQNHIQQHASRIEELRNLTNSNERTIVTTTISVSSPNKEIKRTESFDTVMVLENGHWKVDAEQTLIPPSPTTREEEMEKLSKELEKSMQENLESIDEAMDEGMQILNEALEEGSKEMGDSLLQLMNQMNKSMKESIDRLKERRQQGQQEQPQTEPVPPVNQRQGTGEGMI